MEKIIVREKVLNRGRPISAFIELCKDKSYNSPEDLLRDFQVEQILETVFNEQIDTSRFMDSTLYQGFEKICNEEKDNEIFKVMYKVNDEFAVHISQNIYLYHLVPRDPVYFVVPWDYADSKKFIGDSWWESDDEILESLKSLSIVDFLERYKGY